MTKNGAMNMKSLSIAALIALGLAGTACSQGADAEDTEAKPEIETVETAADVGGSFNLGLPNETVATDPANSGGFNLGVPGGSPALDSTDGFNLGADVSASNGLAALPELTTEIGETPEELVIEAPESEDEDDEPIIRLE
ncbi:MAG: hypothetical protein VX599_00655 [Pseudomonadota bacterium]|jgi:hypothetical protein|nr:hypothetical protein [Pseudomonadota bacterium]